MVGRWPTRCLQARRGRTERRNPCSRNPIHAPAPNLTAAQRGWMSEKTPPLRRKGKCFFLTSPFIEPAYVPAASMHHARFHVNAVVLPDRTVLVSGGNGTNEDAPTAVLESEIYHPDTNTWALAAKAQVARMYHSIALLLPDGRVLAAGSNPNRRDDELRLEIFHPPYLFKGPRPFVETAPVEILYG